MPEYSVKRPPIAVPDNNKAQIGRWQGQVISARKASTYPAIRRENEAVAQLGFRLIESRIVFFCHQ